MKILLSFFFGLILKNSLAQVSPYTCDPFEDCTTIGVAGALVPDPDDCERFYVCISLNNAIIPSTNSVPCPDGEYFDQSLRSCKIEETPGVCGPNICDVIINRCISECPAVFTTIVSVANRFNCSTYYVCLQSSPVLVSCPSDTPYFDGTTCVLDASQCCDFCTAYCETAGTQIVDPCDCTSYYVCLSVGVALPNFRLNCDPGTYYDETTATCKDGPCSNICSSCGTENPSTTTTTTLSADTTTTTTSSADTTTTTTLSADTTTTTTLSADTTTSTLSAATTTTTPGNGCQSLESFTCPNTEGNYAMCPFCNRDYFYCYDGVAAVGRCSGNTVFNPVPQYPYCLDPSNCPYP